MAQNQVYIGKKKLFIGIISGWVHTIKIYNYKTLTSFIRLHLFYISHFVSISVPIITNVLGSAKHT
jgi:hypothetical protein